ncbi:MAG: GNAT family N-acetyltransferase [Acidobacteria bacterium]|nr:GNAT family N-acetyltransferase [Acidobacteriota bacterium]
MLKIAAAETEEQYRQVRELMAEYIEWDSSLVRQLGLDPQEFLDFYYGAGEEALPGIFAPPDGCILLVTYSGKAAGCGAFHRITSDSCEMKRMYVRPEFRGMGIGLRLAETLIVAAREAGYSSMRLETTKFMERAIALYSSLGFRTCQPYYSIPPNFRGITVFMELDLAGAK